MANAQVELCGDAFKINRLSDIKLTVQLTRDGEAVPAPEWDMRFEFYVDGAGDCSCRRAVCTRTDGVEKNLHVNDDGTITCYLDRPHFPCGTLWVKYWDIMPDTDFTDADYRICTPQELPIEIVDGKGCACVIGVDIDSVGTVLHVDTELDTTSTNPIANKPVAEAIEELRENGSLLEGDYIQLERSSVTTITITEASDDAITTLTTYATEQGVAEDLITPVTEGLASLPYDCTDDMMAWGVWDSVDALADYLAGVDGLTTTSKTSKTTTISVSPTTDAVTADSDALITSGAVYDALNPERATATDDSDTIVFGSEKGSQGLTIVGYDDTISITEGGDDTIADSDDTLVIGGSLATLLTNYATKAELAAEVERLQGMLTAGDYISIEDGVIDVTNFATHAMIKEIFDR